MDTKNLVLRLGETELIVVPSIHYNHVFARRVNQICHASEGAPEAIAVELGPRAASEARLWLSELGGKNAGLPVMFGLMKRNRRIRASLRQKALQLQKDTGKDLSELSPEVLRRELGYSGYSLLCLSPTDSIIEAIRCGIELGLPSFGVDLDDMADGVYDAPVLIQNPDALEGLVDYIDRNADLADLHRDEEVDLRRETVMASRIKATLQRYKRVLFVCGMAHWLSISNMLTDQTVKPALTSGTPERIQGEFKRLVVHPLVALQYMDSFPKLAIAYEKTRISASNRGRRGGGVNELSPTAIFDKELKRSCRRYFHTRRYLQSNDERKQDIEKIALFQGYLGNLCVLSNRQVPHLSMIANAAKETMSADFTQILTKTFMDIPWVSPDDFQDCELLSPSGDEGHNTGATVLINGEGRQGGSKFFVRCQSTNAAHAPATISFDWGKARKLMERATSNFTSHTWSPWNRLITSLSLRAIEESTREKITNIHVQFEGSLLHGIDIKKTIHSFSRGKETYFVRDCSCAAPDQPDFVGGFPVVWIIRPGNIDGSDWRVLYEPCNYMERHIKDKAAFERVRAKKGSNMVAIIAYGQSYCDESTLSRPSGARCDRYAGITIFQPISWSNRQFAHWAEITGYRRAPFCETSLFGNDLYGGLAKQYREKHRIRIEDYHWTTTMILLAIPYAKEVLTVVAPDGYRLERVVHEKASQYGVQVKPVFHKKFAADDLARLERCHLVPAITYDPECIYTEDIETYIGEKQTDNLDLIPAAVRDFGYLT